MQLNDAHSTLDHIESTATVDITSLQAQLKHDQLQNSELRSAAREVDWVRLDFEHKLAQAQEQAMHARADAEAVRAELEALRASVTEEPTDADASVVSNAPATAPTTSLRLPPWPTTSIQSVSARRSSGRSPWLLAND